jgi:hypothetical protein
MQKTLLGAAIIFASAYPVIQIMDDKSVERRKAYAIVGGIPAGFYVAARLLKVI